MRQFLTRNLGWKLLSLFVAVALWIAVAREPELATSLSVPIEFKNMPDDLDFNSAVPDNVHLEVRGQSGRLSHDDLADVAVILDLSDAHPGERTYTIHDNNINLPSGVTFYRATPSQVTLSFDRLVTRELPVLPSYAKLPDGYRIQSDAVQPSRIRIRGPEERVRSVDAVKTDPIDLSGVVGEKEFRSHIRVGDPQIRLVSPNEVTVRVLLQHTNGKVKR